MTVHLKRGQLQRCLIFIFSSDSGKLMFIYLKWFLRASYVLIPRWMERFREHRRIFLQIQKTCKDDIYLYLLIELTPCFVFEYSLRAYNTCMELHQMISKHWVNHVWFSQYRSRQIYTFNLSGTKFYFTTALDLWLDRIEVFMIGIIEFYQMTFENILVEKLE